jgi:carbonic anhydrase
MKLVLLFGAAGTLLRQPAAPFPSFAEHGTDWAEACSSGVLQSPIDLDGPVLGAPAAAAPFAFTYPAFTAVDIENDGRAISAKGWGGNQGAGLFHPEVGWHDFVALRVRGGSEHTVQGHRAQLELQLVHRAPSGSTVIAAVLVDPPAGEASADPSEDVLANYTSPAPGGNAVLEPLLVQRPPRMQESVVENTSTMDLTPLLQDAMFVEYAGSETLPPCGGALWLVRRDPVQAPTDQLARLLQASNDLSDGHGNWRWVQPGNARPLIVRTAKQEERKANPPAEPYENGPAYGPYMGKDDTVFKGDQMAHDVMTIEKYVADYAKDLDTRLQNSALARIAAPPTAPPTAAPVPGAELDKSDPLYAIKALNNAKDIFTNAVHETLKSDEVTAKLHDAANGLTKSVTRTQTTRAVNQTIPAGGAAMHAALRR